MTKRPNATACLAALFAALIVVASPAPADAASRVCRDLESRLASLGSSGGGSSSARRYEKAVGDQREQISKAERQRSRAGCSGGIFSRCNPGNVCQSLDNTLDRMRKNLAGLERKLKELGGGGSPRERKRLLASLDANGCRDERVASRQAQPRMETRGRSLFEQLFGGPVEDDNRRVPDTGQRRFPLDEDNRVRTVVRRGGPIEIEPRFSGTFRTLCVRTCDGYYFPVSFSTSAPDLDRDAAACETMCPGTEVELYLHRAPEEESDQMVSRAGIPYTELPTAFKYREAGYQRPEGCGCNPVRNFSIIAGNGPQAAQPEETAPTEPLIPVPVARPDPASDPETLANRNGGLDVGTIRRLLGRGKTATSGIDIGPDDDDRKIRVVGPAFLPDPGEAIDLRAPAPSQVQ
jgi:hypothetical protein